MAERKARFCSECGAPLSEPCACRLRDIHLDDRELSGEELERRLRSSALGNVLCDWLEGFRARRARERAGR